MVAKTSSKANTWIHIMRNNTNADFPVDLLYPKSQNSKWGHALAICLIVLLPRVSLYGIANDFKFANIGRASNFNKYVMFIFLLLFVKPDDLSSFSQSFGFLLTDRNALFTQLMLRMISLPVRHFIIFRKHSSGIVMVSLSNWKYRGWLCPELSAALDCIALRASNSEITNGNAYY